MGSRSSYGGRDAAAPCRTCHSSHHRGRLSPDASSHDYRLWQSSCSSRHNMGRMLSAFAGCCHNRQTSGPSILPCGAGESGTPVHIGMAYLGGYDGYQWAIFLSVEEWAQARYLLDDTGSGVQGQPFIFIFEGIGLALGQATLAVEVVNPILTYDSWRASFIDCPPQLKVRQRVEILLGGLLSFLKTEDSGTDFLDFRKVLVIQLKLSCLESGLRRSGRGCGLSIIGFQLLSYLGGSGTIFGAACRSVIAAFPESMGDLDFETSRRRFLLWGKLISLI